MGFRLFQRYEGVRSGSDVASVTRGGSVMSHLNGPSVLFYIGYV